MDDSDKLNIFRIDHLASERVRLKCIQSAQLTPYIAAERHGCRNVCTHVLVTGVRQSRLPNASFHQGQSAKLVWCVELHHQVPDCRFSAFSRGAHVNLHTAICMAFADSAVPEDAPWIGRPLWFLVMSKINAIVVGVAEIGYGHEWP